MVLSEKTIVLIDIIEHINRRRNIIALFLTSVKTLCYILLQFVNFKHILFEVIVIIK